MTKFYQYNKNTNSITAVDIVGAPSVANSAHAHNGVYRGKNLTNIYTMDQISEKIQANDWSDLYIGDYIEVPQTSVYATETVRWLFAGFDIYLNRGGGTPLTSHHIAMIPEDCFVTTAQMNSTNTIIGAYHNSAMHQTVLPNYASALSSASAFGTHMATYSRQLSDTINESTPSMTGAGWTGASTSFAWYDTQLSLMTEIEVYGSTILSSSLYDVGIGNQQLPLFRHAPGKLVCGTGLGNPTNARWYWWLSAVTNKNSFAAVTGTGFAFGGHSHEPHGVRPLLLFI